MRGIKALVSCCCDCVPCEIADLPMSRVYSGRIRYSGSVTFPFLNTTRFCASLNFSHASTWKWVASYESLAWPTGDVHEHMEFYWSGFWSSCQESFLSIPKKQTNVKLYVSQSGCRIIHRTAYLGGPTFPCPEATIYLSNSGSGWVVDGIFGTSGPQVCDDVAVELECEDKDHCFEVTPEYESSVWLLQASGFTTYTQYNGVWQLEFYRAEMHYFRGFNPSHHATRDYKAEPLYKYRTNSPPITFSIGVEPGNCLQYLPVSSGGGTDHPNDTLCCLHCGILDFGDGSPIFIWDNELNVWEQCKGTAETPTLILQKIA